MYHWAEYELGELLEKIIGGGTPSKRNPDYWDGEIPWVSVKDMKDGVFSLSGTTDHITEEGLQNSSANLIPAGTVIISTRMGLGRCFINKVDMTINQDLKALVPTEKLDNDYLLWLMASKAEEIQALGTGTTVKGIRLEELRALKVRLPELHLQKETAGILNTYNNLIENNNRRIEIFETIAQKLYQEWFVHYRFPNHAQTRWQDTPQGKIPLGWEVKLVADVIQRKKAGTRYTQKNVKESGGVVVIDQSRAEALGYHDNAADHLATPTNPIAIFGDHTCKMQLMIKPFSVGPNVVPFVPKNNYPAAYIFYLVHSLVETQEYKRHWTELNAKEVVIATSELAEKFSNLVSPMLQKINILQKANVVLRESRDMLLSKLIQ